MADTVLLCLYNDWNGASVSLVSGYKSNHLENDYNFIYKSFNFHSIRYKGDIGLIVLIAATERKLQETPSKGSDESEKKD